MRAEFAYEEAQKYLRQRNRLAVVAGVLGLASLLGLGAAATRDREVVLVPVTSERLSLTTAGPDAHYLELVTRATALMLPNRSPHGLEFGRGETLTLADTDRKRGGSGTSVVVRVDLGGRARLSK